MKKVKSTITQRWLINSLGVTFVVLLAVLLAFSIFVNTYYYSTARQYVTTRMNVISSTLQQAYDSNPGTFSSEVCSLVENWSDKDKMELMTLSLNGTVTMTSSGFMPTEDIVTQDFYDAVESGSSGYHNVKKRNIKIAVFFVENPKSLLTAVYVNNIISGAS